jgi:hypothetical protein
MARYLILTYSNRKTGQATMFAVIDHEAYPEDPDNYLKDHVEWYRKEMLESFELVRFPVHARQSESEARKRAQQYADFMNREDDAIKIATKLVTI